MTEPSDKYLVYLMNQYGLTYSYMVDSDNKHSPFPRDTKITYQGNTGTVMAQVLHYDGDEMFWGNVCLLMDDGSKVYTNGWMIEKIKE